MSAILKLEVCGIRSFGPNTSQGIEFEKPLTVISGQNGCGKTTIIECLKYATTGLLPPNSRKGQLFVHDPKMSNVSEVKASVKLLFETRAKQKSFVGRSLCLTEKRNKQEFKAMDMVLKIRDPQTGRSTSQTNKCAEMDRLIPTLLGVSRSILENVIFCHQEDSNWPLQEGSVLKKKFDDIFESSRYTKALEAIKTEKKNLADKLKQATNDLKLAGAYLKKFEDLNSELEGHSDDLKKVNASLEEKECDLRVLTEKGQNFKEAIESVAKYKDKIARYQVEMKTRSKLNDVDKERVGKHYFACKMGSDEKPNLASFQLELEKTNSGIEDDNCELSRVKQKRFGDEQRLKQLNREQEKYITVQAELESRKNNLIKLKRDLANLIEDNSVKYGLSNSVAEAEDSITSFREVFRRREAELHEEENDWKQIVGKLDEEIMKHRSELSVLEQKEKDLKLMRSNLLHKKEEITGSFNTLSSKKGAFLGSSVEQIEEEINLTEQKLEKHRGDGKVLVNIERDLEKKKEDEMKLDLELDKLKKMKLRLERDYDKIAVISSKKMDLSTRLSLVLDEKIASCNSLFRESGALSKDLSHLKDSILAAGDHSNATPLRLNSIENALEEAKRLEQIVKDSIENEQLKFLKVENNKVETDAQVRFLFERKEEYYRALQNLRKEHETLTETLPKIEFLNRIIAEDFNDERRKVQKAREKLIKLVDETRKEYSELKFEIELRERFGAGIHENKSCPVCSQRIADKLQAKATVDICIEKEFFKFRCSMSDSVTVLLRYFEIYNPSKGVDAAIIKALEVGIKAKSRLQRLEKNLESAQSALDSFDIHSKTYLKVLELEEKDIPETRQKWDECVREYETKKEEATNIVNEFERIKQFLENSTLNEKAFESVTKDLEAVYAIGVQILQLEESLGTDISTASMEAVRNQYDTAERNKQTILKQRDLLFEERRAYMERTQQLEKEIQSLKMKIYEQKETHRVLHDLKAERSKIDSELRELDEQYRDVHNRLPKVKKLALKASIDKEDLSKKYETGIKRRRRELNICENDLTKSSEMLKALNHSKFDELQDEISRVVKEKEELNQERKSIEIEIEQSLQTEKDISDRINTSRDSIATLESCIKILLVDQDIELLREKMDIATRKMNSKLGETVDAEEKLKEINEAMDSLRLSRERLRGERDQLERRVGKCREDLKDQNLKNIESKYKNLLIEKTTLNMAVQDLDQYYKALDAALVQFHAIKIKQINEQVRELWQLTYRGGDIDRIEIRADKSNSKIGTRSYNYRVVMCKGSTELDMRGRCSAGQKVLASLVIRMALASSFSAACGILALDEPTTNLDVENKRSLALALSSVIKERTDESSFQLIIITHDEEFVELLKQNIQIGGEHILVSNTCEFCTKVEHITKSKEN